MGESYRIPAGEASSRISVKNSRFIGRACCTASVEEARAFIRQTAGEEPGASHVVYGFIIGHGNSVTYGMSDAGEPPGTAGRPVLEVLKGSGLGDITLVVVRYFGGTKLGTGGLVKAYTESAQETLKPLKTVKKVKKLNLELTFSYNHYNQFARIIEEYEGEVLAKDFTADVALKLLVPEDSFSGLESSLMAASGGKVKIIFAGK